MADDLVRFMHSLFLPAARGLQEGLWQPSADVYRAPDGWLVKFDLAGVRFEDIQLTAQGRCLTLRGCRRDWSAEEGASHYRMEISYSHFQRSFELPCDLDRCGISADSRDGMLHIHITETEK